MLLAHPGWSFNVIPFFSHLPSGTADVSGLQAKLELQRLSAHLSTKTARALNVYSLITVQLQGYFQEFYNSNDDVFKSEWQCWQNDLSSCSLTLAQTQELL